MTGGFLRTATLIMAAASFGAAAERQYTRLFLPLPANHDSEAFAVNSKSEVLRTSTLGLPATGLKPKFEAAWLEVVLFTS